MENEAWWVKYGVEADADDLYRWMAGPDAVERIIEEAERRGREAALEEVTNRMFEELEAVRALRAINPDAYKKEYQYGIFQAYRIIKSKLSSLSQLPDAKINELKGV